MDKRNVFTSTGIKLLQHPEVIHFLQRGRFIPVSLQVAPTSRCNLNCSFCSNSKRSKHEDLDRNELFYFIDVLQRTGLKTVEITGGGDPTMYHSINELIECIYESDLEVGLISNGILLKEKISPRNLNSLTWLRVSLNSLEYCDDIDLPKINGTLGFSFVIHSKNINNILKYGKRIRKLVDKYHASYVRIVPDCLPGEDEKRLNVICEAFVREFGEPFFFQEKIFRKPDNCWWGYLKPFLLHDKFVYPCSSVVLNSGSEGVFHEKFRVATMDDFLLNYRQGFKVNSFPTANCDRCVFANQNDMVDSILNPNKMRNFL